jgi:hypothetical protein
LIDSVNNEIQKKYDELKKKIENLKVFKIKTENLIKTKSDVISHEN